MVDAQKSFAPVPGEIRMVRNFVRTSFAEWGRDHDLDAVVVVVNELATNAVMHGREQFQVKLTQDGPVATVEVSDDNPRLPVPVPADENATSGRGLDLVDALASGWGIHQHPNDGKTVWANFNS